MLLYYITDRMSFAGTESEQRAAVLHRIAEAARAGVDYIQLRERDLEPADLELLAREALHRIRESSATSKLLINTHSEVALSIGADGVHLPADSPPVSTVRANWLRQTNREPLIGVSAHGIAEIRRAETEAAGFAVLAPVFGKVATGTEGIGVDVLQKACAPSHIPVLALGGVNRANARACIEAGAAGIAGIRLFQQGDVGETVRQLRSL